MTYGNIPFRCFFFNTGIHDISSFSVLLITDKCKVSNENMKKSTPYLHIQSENRSKNSHLKQK